MTDQPQGTMLKLKIKRDPVTGVATIDPNDPMAALVMAALGSNVAMQLDNLLNPEGDDMPEIKSDAGVPGYQYPDTGPTQTMEVDKERDRISSIIKGSPSPEREEKHMRRQALEFASQTHGGQTPEMIVNAAQRYYDFLAGNAEELAKAAPSD